MRYRTLVPVLLLLLAPSLSFAAGFAKQSLFLSQSPVTEGDHVRIYAILTNSSASKFTGTLTFKDGTTEIGSVAAAIDAGGTQTASVAWSPAAGDHAVTAELSSGGTVVEQESENFSIAAKPAPAAPIPPSEQYPVAVGSSQAIQNGIGSLSPAAESATAPIFSTIDSLRGGAASLIDSQLASAKNKLAGSQTGLVEGASVTQNPQLPGNLTSILWTLYIYLLTLLRFLVDNAGVFYPVLAVAFLYMLWKLLSRFRRPSY